MARPIDAPETSSWRDVALVAAVAIAAIVGLVVITAMVASGGAPPETQPTGPAVAGSPSDAASASPAEPSGSVPGSTSGKPSASSAPVSESPGASTDTFPTPAATPTPTPVAGAAPMSPDGFDLERQIIPIGFPLLRQTRYEYRNNFLDVREGPPDAYNHARIRSDGTSVRLHDGIDIYADEGEPLVAVFSGTVLDPTDLWEPWEPDRYGRVVVIRSDEPQTMGYIALYAHADRVWVETGAHVSRGQVLGAVGRTGNAEIQSIRTHVHFELRAPFPLDWTSLGEERQIDAFNAYPSLRAADPKRS